MYCNYTVIPCAALLTAHRHRSSISRLSINAAASRAWSSYSHNRFSKSDSFVAAQPLAYRELLQGVCLICWETHTSNRLRRQEEKVPREVLPPGEIPLHSKRRPWAKPLLIPVTQCPTKTLTEATRLRLMTSTSPNSAHRSLIALPYPGVAPTQRLVPQRKAGMPSGARHRVHRRGPHLGGRTQAQTESLKEIPT